MPHAAQAQMQRDSLSLQGLKVNLKQYVPHDVIIPGKGEGRCAGNSLKIL